MATQADLHVGDVGTIIYFNIKEAGAAADVSTATVQKARFQKKDKTTFDVTTVFDSDGTDGILKYVTQTGDIDQKGRWNAQVYLELPAWQGWTSKIDFQVDDPLPTPTP